MIGQVNLLNKIDKIISKFPKFSIVVGPKNSGKEEICKYICSKLKLPIVKFGTSIDDIREIIALSYEQTKPLCYLCTDADVMSVGAKNSLLKITEEPPRNAYFMFTLLTLENTLETLKSRGTVLTLDNYSAEEIIAYRKYRGYNSATDDIVSKACTTTGEVDELFKYNIVEFASYVNSLFKYIHMVNSGNLFKITKSLALKETDDGYSCFLVFNLLRKLYIDEALNTHDSKYLNASNVTSKCLLDLNLSTVSKQGTVDNWIFEVRKALCQ